MVRQSERTEFYRAALERLESDGRVYPCWCTRAEIRAAGEAPHGPLPEGAYPGTCRSLDASERAERERSGRPAALRLDAGSAEIAFHDRLHGDLSGAVDDFVLWRGDDTPAYQLAVVVDDADQGVDEVVRGDDLLDSAPRQLLLARLLGLPAPAYAHVPLVVGPDGAAAGEAPRGGHARGSAALGEGARRRTRVDGREPGAGGVRGAPRGGGSDRPFRSRRPASGAHDLRNVRIARRTVD